MTVEIDFKVTIMGTLRHVHVVFEKDQKKIGLGEFAANFSMKITDESLDTFDVQKEITLVDKELIIFYLSKCQLVIKSD